MAVCTPPQAQYRPTLPALVNLGPTPHPWCHAPWCTVSPWDILCATPAAPVPKSALTLAPVTASPLIPRETCVFPPTFKCFESFSCSGGNCAFGPPLHRLMPIVYQTRCSIPSGKCCKALSHWSLSQLTNGHIITDVGRVFEHLLFSLGCHLG